jgi:hypothetical protein
MFGEINGIPRCDTISMISMIYPPKRTSVSWILLGSPGRKVVPHHFKSQNLDIVSPRPFLLVKYYYS